MNEFTANPVLLSANALHANIGERVLIDNQDIILREGEHVGIVGRNGAGKSTMLRILAGRDQFFAGKMTIRKGTRAVYLPQSIELDGGRTIRDNILDGAAGTLELLRKYESHTPEISPDELERELSSRDGWGLEKRLNELMTSLAVPAPERLVGELSGGEKRRVALCKTLIDLPELLLLDEPTNHLDAETIEWLENYITSSKATFLYITHDRYFLDRTCTSIMELQNGIIYTYPGNYGDFLRKKAERAEQEQQNEEKRLAFIRREIDWIRRGPKARGTKSWSRIQRFNDAVNTAPPPVERDAELLMPPPEKFGDIIANLEHVTLSRGGKCLFNDLTLKFTDRMRLGIIGRNGLGKSSLLKLLLGELTPEAGTVRIGERTRMNYADQHRVSLDDSKTVVEDVGEGNEHVMFGERKLSVWTYLRRFLFQDDELNTRIGELSGGERNRLVLAKILKRGGNFLLLDEPTNDLDLPTLRVLEEALMNFAGCVAVVSHDRYFLNRVCTHILSFEGDGKLIFQPGDYQYFREKRAERQEELQTAALQAERQQKAEAAAAKPKRQRLTWKEQRELEGMEEAILKAEENVARLEGIFAEPDFHVKHGQRTAELTAELEQARKDVETLYARWTELEAKAQAAG